MGWKPIIEVLDFSGFFSGEQGLFPSETEEKFCFRLHDFRDLDGTMCFCSDESAEQIRRRLDPSVASHHWIDTGDYHYLTYFFLERLTEPFTLVLLDNHPDDQASAFGGDLLSCGGWVRTASERLPLLRRVVSIGTTVPVEAAAQVLREVVRGGGAFYLSVDKDILSKEYARTDWSQGSMTLPQLLDLLDLLRGTRWLGVDICGGLTEAKGASPEDFAVNARTDAALFDKLEEIVKIKI